MWLSSSSDCHTKEVGRLSMEPEVSLLEPSTDPYPEPDESNTDSLTGTPLDPY
jgi:hypothetical protein